MKEWLSEGHLAYFISDAVDAMDLCGIESAYEKELRGQPPYHPRMMTKVLIYAYCTGVYSSRKIAKKLEEDVAFRVLGAQNQPDFRTISDFRKLHLEGLSELFKQVLMMCRKTGMVRLGHVALDGTKQKANASKHKAMSYGRMKEESARLECEIAELLANAQRTDAEEDLEYGPDVRGDELPEELAFREGRLGRIKQAMAELEAEAKESAGSECEKPHECEVEEAGSGEPEDVSTSRAKKRGRPPKKPVGVPDDKAQKNFTDPESKIMLAGDKSFIQGYNAQAAVDSEYQVVVATMVSNQASDAAHVQAMTEKIEKVNGRLPDEMSLDAGYYSDANVGYLEGKGVDVYMPPCRLKHSEYRKAKPFPVTEVTATCERMKSKVLTDDGRAKYGLRKETVEPVFGQIKRCMGFRQFSMRGKNACEAEWSLVCAAHNLKKLFKYGAAAAQRKANELTIAVGTPDFLPLAA